MRIIGIKNVGKNFKFRWPKEQEIFDYFIDYEAIDHDGKHNIRVGFCKRQTYGKNRMKVVVWIDDYPYAEFLGADDFENSGEVLSEIKISDRREERILRYPDEPIPERYAQFNVVGLPLRVQGSGVHKAWAVVTSIADHKTLIDLAALRRLEKAIVRK
jgi:hypothetical protein